MAIRFVAIWLAALALAPAATAEDFAPTAPIELVVMTGKGGGADVFARAIVEIAEEERLFEQPIEIINLSGGYGAGAIQYVMQADNPNVVLLATLNSFYTAPLLQEGLGVDTMEFTPIAMLAEESFLLWVHAEKGPADIDMFKARAQETSGGWVMAGAGFGSEHEILTKFVGFALGADISYRGLGAGRATRELIDGRIDGAIGNPSETVAHYRAGRLRPLLAFSDERLARFPNTPTLKEIGVNFVYSIHRQIVGGPEMSEAARAYYEARLLRVFESEKWRALMEEHSWDGGFVSGLPLKYRWLDASERHKQLLQAIGALE